MSHSFVLLPPRNESWDWDTFTVGIFEWVPSQKPGVDVQRGPVKLKVTAKFSQGGVQAARAKVYELIKLLDKGMYSGPRVVDLVSRV